MKTIVKIDPEKEYEAAKQMVESIAARGEFDSELSTLDVSIDNLKTVINVLIERSTPKKRKRPSKKSKKKKKGNNNKDDNTRLPSEKFPELEVNEKIIKPENPPRCSCCNEEMKESGLFKTSEKLEVVPKKYYIARNKRVIYNCGACNGSMVNAPNLPCILPTSNYGDSLIIDVALSKYCDLIPIERYTAIAGRDGVNGLPPNSLIGLTHALASFFYPVYQKLREEILSAILILADETPLKMLEGDVTSNWFLWGFSSSEACFFEAHGTRSGDIPIEFLLESNAEFLLTDGYGGYKRAVKEINKEVKRIAEVYCNAHAFRYFDEASSTWKSECEPFLELYGKIYELEREAENDEQKGKAREAMKPLFEEIKRKCEEARLDVMANSKFEKAIMYFLNHYPGLIICTTDIRIPLDNNFSERLLRSPVVGRKTWYGNHSKRGARTSAVLFSLVESCKINDINPRNYFPWLTDRILSEKEPLTPHQYLNSIDSG